MPRRKNRIRGDLSTRINAVVRKGEAEKRNADLLPTIEAARAASAKAFHSIAAHLNEQGIGTPRAGEWSLVQVRRVVAA